MVVARVKSGNVITFTGTVAEVAQEISDQNVPAGKFMVFYNGTNITALYKTL